MAYIVLPPEFIPKLSTVINWIMSFTPLLSYGSTILSIRKKQSSQGFSMDICATMLIASTLRIFYYFNDPFEITLLRQCFVMIFIQTLLLKVALKYRSPDTVYLEKYESNWEELQGKFYSINIEMFWSLMEDNVHVDESTDFLSFIKGIAIVLLKTLRSNLILIGLCLIEVIRGIVRLFDVHFVRPFHFWQWRDSLTYWKFLFGFLALISFVQLMFNNNEYLGLAFGSLSFMIESSLPLPQILLFQRFKSVANFKTILLLSWLGGDLTKISYLFYGTDNIGPIFVIAAFIQMSMNLVITYQFFYYSRHPGVHASDIPLSSFSPTSQNEIDLALPSPKSLTVPFVPQHQHQHHNKHEHEDENEHENEHEHKHEHEDGKPEHTNLGKYHPDLQTALPIPMPSLSASKILQKQNEFNNNKKNKSFNFKFKDNSDEQINLTPKRINSVVSVDLGVREEMRSRASTYAGDNYSIESKNTFKQDISMNKIQENKN